MISIVRKIIIPVYIQKIQDFIHKAHNPIKKSSITVILLWINKNPKENFSKCD